MPGALGKNQALEKARSVARRHGKGSAFLCVKWKNTRSKYFWRCSSGHVWQTEFSNVVYRNSWCPRCSHAQSHSLGNVGLDRARKCAQSHGEGSAFLSLKWRGTDTKYQWCCSKGHHWKAQYSSVVLNHSWCKRCLLAGWTKFDKKVSTVMPPGSERITKRYVDSYMQVKVRCGKHRTIHNPYYFDVVYGGGGLSCCRNFWPVGTSMFIYGVKEPISNLYYYVGITKKHETRLKLHLATARTAVRRRFLPTPFGVWLLSPSGSRASLEILETVSGIANARAAEKRLIGKFRRLGHPLMNIVHVRTPMKRQSLDG